MIIIKFIYSEKATKFCEVSTLLFLSYVVSVKSKVEISQNFVAISEYMNFNHISAGGNNYAHQITTGFQTFLPTALEHVSAPNIYCVGYDIDSLHVHVIQVYYVMTAIHTVEI